MELRSRVGSRGRLEEGQICVLERANAGGRRVVIEVFTKEPALRVDLKRELKGQ